MRKWLRHILNALTVLSLLLFLATILIWIFAKPYHSGISIGGKGYSFFAQIKYDNPEITFESAPENEWNSLQGDPTSAMDRVDLLHALGGFTGDMVIDHHWSLPGLSFRSEHIAKNIRPNWRRKTLNVSYWLIFAITLLLPLSRIRIRRRVRSGLCPVCHYDLRATPDRCPECGTVTTNKNIPENRNGPRDN